ncbi:MAG: hypothetical protein JJT75_13550 [Opitutales bacterium]|nr:hypothetical protein [Opitutales bacterium]MCH8540651.1 DUF6064 family protein [Opitutales bacterium]
MRGEWGTYAIRDFIPFTPDVYFRLIERTNESLWPLHLLVLGIGLGILALFYVRRPRIASLPLALIWIWVGVAFLLRDYADLTPIGFWFGWAFCLQGLLLLGLGMTGGFRCPPIPTKLVSTWVGVIIAVYGLLLYPVLTGIAGGAATRSEVFGIHPDPTAIATLGILLVVTKSWRLGVLAVIPVLWCITSGLTLLGLESNLALSPFAAAALVMMGMIWVFLGPLFKSKNPDKPTHPE